jgi:hypothetical protein
MTRYITHPLALLGIVLALTMGFTAWAQESDKTQEPEQNKSATGQVPTGQAKSAKTDQQNASSAGKKPGKKKQDDEVFRPSEEISEDFAVSFPVDI